MLPGQLNDRIVLYFNHISSNARYLNSSISDSSFILLCESRVTTHQDEANSLITNQFLLTIHDGFFGSN